MCDGWTIITNKYLNNLLVWSHMSTLFIDATKNAKDANYLNKLIDEVIEESEYEVQMVMDNDIMDNETPSKKVMICPHASIFVWT